MPTGSEVTFTKGTLVPEIDVKGPEVQ
jgi:hypothetical protein